MRILISLLYVLFSFKVLLAASFYDEKDFRELFLREFRAKSQIKSDEISLEKFRVEPSSGIKISKDTPLKIEWIGTPRAGSNTALFIFKTKGSENQILRVWGYVEIKVPVFVAKRILRLGESLNEEDFVIEKRALTKLPHDVVTDSTEFLGKELRVSLKPGDILRKAHLVEPLLVKRNQEVEILAKGKNFTVKAKGIAMQNGRLGEYIKVKNISSQRVIQARVSGKNLVEVSF